MTRKISEQAARAFYEQRNFKKDNTEVIKNSRGLMCMYLFGNIIATWLPGSKDVLEREWVHFNMGGWNSMTTRDRLRALGIDIRSQQGTPCWQTDGIINRLSTEHTYYYEVPKKYTNEINWPNKDMRTK